MAATADSTQLEHGSRMIYAGLPSFFGLGLEDGLAPTFWLLVYVVFYCHSCTVQSCLLVASLGPPSGLRSKMRGVPIAIKSPSSGLAFLYHEIVGFSWGLVKLLQNFRNAFYPTL